MCNALKDHVGNVEENIHKGKLVLKIQIQFFSVGEQLQPVTTYFNCRFVAHAGEADRDELRFEDKKRIEQFQVRKNL